MTTEAFPSIVAVFVVAMDDLIWTCSYRQAWKRDAATGGPLTWLKISCRLQRVFASGCLANKIHGALAGHDLTLLTHTPARCLVSSALLRYLVKLLLQVVVVVGIAKGHTLSGSGLLDSIEADREVSSALVLDGLDRALVSVGKRHEVGIEVVDSHSKGRAACLTRHQDCCRCHP